MLTESHLVHGSAERLVIAALKGGNGAWQAWLCGRLLPSSTGVLRIGLSPAILPASEEPDELASAILHTIRNAPELTGSKADNTHGVRGTGATCAIRRLRAARVPRHGKRCCLCEQGQTERCCFKWAAASQKQEVRAKAREHRDLRGNLIKLITALPVSTCTVATPALWVSAAQNDICAMVESTLWKSPRRYCTLQPARAAAMARANVGTWTLQEWQVVTVGELQSVSPDQNGLFRAAVKSLKADATVTAMGHKLAAWCRLDDPGDPRLWSCWWCQAHLKYADAVEVFK